MPQVEPLDPGPQELVSPDLGPQQDEPLHTKTGYEELEPQQEGLGPATAVPAGGVGDGSSASTIADTSFRSRIRKRPASRLVSEQLMCRANAQAPCMMQLSAGVPWLVHVSSTTHDENEILRCSGIAVHWDMGQAWVLTSYRAVFCIDKSRLYDPIPKLAVHVEKAVHLPSKGIYEGSMMFFSQRYQLALLKIEVEATIEVEPPSLHGSGLCYGDEVLALARDKELSSTHCHGTIMWRECIHLLLLNCKLCPCGIGGPVINNAGDILGMSSSYKRYPTIVSITTIRRCIEMLTNFGRIARPMLGMSFRTVDFLDITHQDRLRCKYKIKNGFIVHQVEEFSAAEIRGIRRGDVITSFDGISCYLPKFEDFLLDVGLESLGQTRFVNDFKLEVYDLLRVLDKPREALFCP